MSVVCSFRAKEKASYCNDKIVYDIRWNTHSHSLTHKTYWYIEKVFPKLSGSEAKKNYIKLDKIVYVECWVYVVCTWWMNALTSELSQYFRVNRTLWPLIATKMLWSGNGAHFKIHSIVHRTLTTKWLLLFSFVICFFCFVFRSFTITLHVRRKQFFFWKNISGNLRIA